MSDTDIAIRLMAVDDLSVWVDMRLALWPDASRTELAAYADEFMGGGTSLKAVFMAEVNSETIGFIELGERSVAEGCWDAPCAYIEGWWVAAPHRGHGVGRALVDAAARWARNHDYTNLASDTELKNLNSQKAHIALGFQEEERAVHYVMRLEE